MNALTAIKNRIRGTLQERISLHEKYQAVFGTPSGEEVLRHICKKGHVFDGVFVAGDPHMTSFNEGQRHLALSILRFVKRDREELIKQVEEGMEHD